MPETRSNATVSLGTLKKFLLIDHKKKGGRIVSCCEENLQNYQKDNVRITVTLRRVRVIVVAVESSEYYVFWVCVCSFSYPTRKGMRRVILSTVACPAVPCFSTLSHTLHDFRENVIGHKVCVSDFIYNFVWNISRSKKSWMRYDDKCTHVLM
jgi:hypothetical protein